MVSLILPLTNIRGDVNVSFVDEVHILTTERNEMLEEMQEQLLRAQNIMRNQAKKHGREMEYNRGDVVYLLITPYKLKKLAKRVNQKLSPRYYEPCEVIWWIGQVAYELKLPERYKGPSSFSCFNTKESHSCKYRATTTGRLYE